MSENNLTIVSSQEYKQDWFRLARLNINNSKKTVCEVCGKYKSVVESHHIYPFWWQYRNEWNPSNNDIVFLCPTHHKAVHSIINSMIMDKPHSLVDFNERELKRILMVVKLFEKEVNKEVVV